MNNRLAKTAVVLALAALSSTVLAQDRFGNEPPGRVGRVALAQGKVSISGDAGDTVSSALVNWPVTTRNLITTEARARTEVRIGSTAIRIDGDSSLEVTELDDDSIRLRLHYGSASVRIASEEVVREFELVIPQGRVRMLKPGRLRVDAERVRDTSVVSVLDGEAQVDGGGASLLIRAGRSAELRDDDVRTLQARSDAFDDWSLARDRLAEGSRSARYVNTEMTGYEELDRHGAWHDDLEYGPVWTPRVASTWVPYRDGRWSWVAPWGWTWVDHAPWGYAPSHYGRWVHVKNRWAWAPGHYQRRPVWAPALVGWVGGSGWNVSFNTYGSRPATGWYPLGPHDHFVPGYRLSDERLRRLNNWHERRGGGRRGGGPDWHDYRQRGLTVVPQAHFGQRGPVVVSNVPRAAPLPHAVPNHAAGAPPAPHGWRERGARRDSDGDGIPNRVDADRDGDGIPNRVDRVDNHRERFERFERFDRPDRPERVERSERGQRPPVMATAPAPAMPVAAMPAPAPEAQPVARPPRGWSHDADAARGEARERGERGERFEGRRDRGQPMAAMPQPMMVMQPQAQVQPQPMLQAPPPQREPQFAPPPRQSLAAPPRVMVAPPPEPAQAGPVRGRGGAERRFDHEDGGVRGIREN